MSLPAPNLDDRTFQDIVDDVKRQIGRRCPEWTDHNVSDPGVTLIELFAWMTEMTLFRLNQVPEKNYIKFLEMIGVSLEPPAPAQTDLRFRLSRPIEDRDGEEAFERLLRARETVAATVRTETESVDRVRHGRRPAAWSARAWPTSLALPAVDTRRAGRGRRRRRGTSCPGKGAFRSSARSRATATRSISGFEADVSGNVIQLEVRRASSPRRRAWTGLSGPALGGLERRREPLGRAGGRPRHHLRLQPAARASGYQATSRPG